MKLPISLVVITLNEERNIERCLRSAMTWVSEMILIDSGSQDKTVEIAEKLGAKVIKEAWRGYGPQKRFGVTTAKNDWILSIDADEEMSPELIQEIQTQFSTLNPKAVHYFPRKSFYLGRWILHGGWYPDYQPRFFNRVYSNWNEAKIHESIQGPESFRLKNPIHHYVFRNIADQVNTNNRYSGLQAETHLQKNQKFSLVKLLIKPFVKFIECYFLKLGCLDGLPGFIIAVSAGYSVFIRWAKVWELEKGVSKS